MSDSAPAGAGVGVGAGSGTSANAGSARDTSSSGTPIAPARRTVPSMFFDEDVEREDGRKYNPQVMSFIRDDWISTQIQERASEFTEFNGLSLFCGTWNVNGKPPDEDITSWLKGGSSGRAAADIYSIAFQEIVDLNAANVVVGAATDRRAALWEAKIQHTLDTLGHKYKLLMTKTLVGVQLSVFAKRSCMDHIKDVQGATAGVGVLGMMGNKGGAAIRFTYDDSSLCFVSSHLAAKRSHVTQRGADYAAIVSKIAFYDAGRAESARASDVSGDSGAYGVLDHDFVFWLGDLNYRIVEGVSIEQVNTRVDANDLAFLRDRDQLNVERAAGRVFQGFTEGHIDFLPTYKYQAGTDKYERRPDKKHRAPAWCDRVLWRTLSLPEHVQQMTYNRTEQKMSDHKPVYSQFKVSVKTVVEAKKENVLREIMRRLDKMENESLPRAKLSSTVVHFDSVIFQRPSQQTITVTNVGEVAASWRFVPKLEEQHVSKGWLVIEPLYGMLPPGESAEITMRCYVDEEVGRAVAHGRDKLQDILIMRLENGADFFLSVTANYLPSCFCLSVGELVRSVNPLRTCPVAAARIESGAASKFTEEAVATPTAAPLRIPKELWRLVDFVYKRGMDCPLVCVAPGLADEVLRVQEALDLGVAIDSDVSVASVGATLVQFLRSLDDSVIPAKLFPQVEFHSVPVATWCKNMLRQLDTPSYNTFAYLVSFLRELLGHPKNQLTAQSLAELFGPILLRVPMPDDVDTFAAAAGAMTTSTPLRAATSAPTLSGALSDAVMTKSQREATVAIALHFLTAEMMG